LGKDRKNDGVDSMKSELEIRKAFETVQAQNRTMEEAAAFITPDGIPRGLAYWKNKGVEETLNWLLTDEGKTNKEDKP
jgi:hypothetical protein